MISTANKVRISGFIILCVLSVSCKKEVPGRSPSVVTTPASQVLYFTASSGGTVVDDGGLLAAGLRESTDGSFQGQDSFGGWWSATEVSSGPLGAALSRTIYGDTTVVTMNQIFKKDGFTVRCLKN